MKNEQMILSMQMIIFKATVQIIASVSEEDTAKEWIETFNNIQERYKKLMDE